LRRAPDSLVASDQVVRPVPEHNLAQVAHDPQVLPVVVHAARGQADERAGAAERVDDVAAHEARAAEDRDAQAADAVPAARAARRAGGLHRQRLSAEAASLLLS
jgi:hypothetical protein